jgi:hypothetical protein
LSRSRAHRTSTSRRARASRAWVWIRFNAHRAYASAVDRTVALLGVDRLLADDEVGAALSQPRGTCAPATWNRNRAAVASWLTWCRTKKRWTAPSVSADVERRKEAPDETWAVAKTTIHRLLSRRDVPLREKTLCRAPLCTTTRPRPGPGRVADPWSDLLVYGQLRRRGGGRRRVGGIL